MELNKLAPFVLMLVAIGVLVGISMIVTSKIGLAGKTEFTVNDSVYLLNNTVNALDHGNITTFYGVYNASWTEFPAANFTLASTNGTIEVSYAGTGNSTCGNGRICYAYYKYWEYNTATATAMSSVTSEVGGISTTWLSIIVICVVAALILSLVMGSFQQRR